MFSLYRVACRVGPTLSQYNVWAGSPGAACEMLATDLYVRDGVRLNPGCFVAQWEGAETPVAWLDMRDAQPASADHT